MNDIEQFYNDFYEKLKPFSTENEIYAYANLNLNKQVRSSQRKITELQNQIKQLELEIANEKDDDNSSLKQQKPSRKSSDKSDRNKTSPNK